MHLDVLSNIALAIAVSIDGFSIGVIYGMKGIRIPLFSQIIIALATSAAISASMVLGKAVEAFLNPGVARLAGAAILFAIGIRSIVEAVKENHSSDVSKTIAALKIKPVGLVVMILREPDVADRDVSGVIDPQEAFLLGTALAMDAFGAGIGAAAAGFNVMLTIILVTIMSVAFLFCGLHIGARRIPGSRNGLARFSPGVLLLALAMTKAFRR
jgi:putative sporulation protein YtaF